MDNSAKAKINLLKKRFILRSDTYALQKKNYDEASWGYWRVKDNQRPVPLTDHALEQHIRGRHTVGAYQLLNGKVKWLCLDIDVNKGVDVNSVAELTQTYTRLLAKRLVHLGITFLVESSGSKGFHIWVFFTHPIDALKAMALGHFVANEVVPPKQIHIEVYPKQSMSEFGNFVKLPLGIHQKTKRPCHFIDGAFAPLPDQWQALRSVKTLSDAQVDALIEEHDIPLQTSLKPVARPGGIALPCMTNLMRQGVEEGARDETTFGLACYLRATGMPLDLAVETLLAWNQTRNPTPLEAQTVRIKAESAYKGGYSHFPCQRRVFDTYCEKECYFYESKMRTRGERV